jgi:phosphoesterase RecJ-like protein
MNKLIPEIVNRLTEADRILLVTHVFPDGDNLGASLAMLKGLKSIGKDVRFYLDGDVPRSYDWLPGSENIIAELPPKDGSIWTIVALDSGDPGRMGESFGEWYEESFPLLNIDHHASNVLYGDINWVDAGYSSTGEMVVEMLDALGVELTRDIATCIFCAIYTDTGRFGYSNTNLRSMSVATRCVKAGARPHETYSKVYASKTLSGLKLLTMALGTLRFFAGDAGCAFHVDQAMFNETGTDASDTENFMETVTQVGEVKIVVFFKEVAPGLIKGSLRCRKPINAYELAAKFDGGGHPRAAGFSIDGAIEEAYDKFIAEAEKALAAVGG